MGSSCYCRGNARNAELIQQELKHRGLEGQVELSGTLCEGRCKDGPIISLDGREYQRVQAGLAADLLDQATLPGSQGD